MIEIVPIFYSLHFLNQLFQINSDIVIDERRVLIGSTQFLERKLNKLQLQMDKFVFSTKNLHRDPSSSKYQLGNYDSKQRVSPGPHTSRPAYKENVAQDDCSPSFKCKEATAERIKRPQEDIQARLQSIRKKYQNQTGSRQPERSVSPLREINNLSPTPKYTELKMCQSKPSIQRSFSFINIESTESKQQTNRFQEESFAQPSLDLTKGLPGWRSPENYPEPASKSPPPNKYSYQNFNSFERKSTPQQTKLPYNRDNRTKNKSELSTFKDKQHQRQIKVNRSTSQNKIAEDPRDYNETVKTGPIMINGQRIDSIDKINVRIKEILQSIKQNGDQGYVDNFKKRQEARYPEANLSPNRPDTKVEARAAVGSIHSKSVNVQMDKYERQYAEPPRQKMQPSPYKIKDSKPVNLNIKYISRHNISDSKPSTNNLFEQRSHTFRIPQSDQKHTEYSSKSIPKPQIRDLDVQIQRIQQKIKRSQEEKKKIMMNEETTKPIYRQSHTVLGMDQKRIVATKIPNSEIKRQEFSSRSTTKYPTSKQHSIPRSPTLIRKVDPEPSSRSFINIQNQNQSFAIEREYKADAYQQQHSYTPTLKLQYSNNYKPEFKQYKHDPSRQELLSRSPNIPKAEELSIKIMPIQCQKHNQLKIGRETKRFIECLKHQVDLDEQLRNAKIWLDSADIYEKWDCINEVLQERGVRMPLEMIEQEFANSLEQHNPFFTIKNYNQTPDTVVDKYLESQNYWADHIQKKFNTQQMRLEHFDENKLDLQRKGYLTVEDLVRFLNIETGTFYRNRDLILVFRRITCEDRVNFSDFMSKIGPNR